MVRFVSDRARLCQRGRMNAIASMLAGRIPVRSSNLRSVGYDEWNGTLTIEFDGGRIYEYFGVPPWVFAGLLAASSHGSYFHENVKGHYDYARLV
jgi:hypothetical protein